MFAGETLVGFTCMFSAYDFKKNDGIILKWFKDKWMEFHRNNG